MAGELDAVGTMAEGGLIARAVEPDHGALASGGVTHESACLNCGTTLDGPYCHQCGQQAHVHRSLAALGHDIAHGVFHFEGKLWHTLPLLLWQPGELTRRYIAGERARFVSPMALFLFALFLMFAVFGSLGTTGVEGAERLERAQRLAEIDRDIAVARRAAEAAPAGSSAAREAAGELRGLTAERQALARQPDGAETEAADIRAAIDLDKHGSFTGLAWLDKRLEKGLSKASHNPDLLLYKLQSNGYKWAWLLIPLSLPFLWLATLGVRGHAWYDHAVFVTYSIGFMSLLAVVLTLLGAIGLPDALLVPAGLIVPPLHIARQLKHAYRLSGRTTVLRMAVVLAGIAAVLIAYLMILLGLGVLG